MYRIHQIKLHLGEPKEKIPEKILRKIGGRDLFIREWHIVKESIDARDKADICWVYSVDFAVASRKNPKKNLRLPSAEKLRLEVAPDMTYRPVVPGSAWTGERKEASFSAGMGEKAKAPFSAGDAGGGAVAAPRLMHRPVVVGLGPAGLFCGLILAQAGYRPLVIERGKDVDRRHEDVERFWWSGVLSADSNVQFGEGGAGTFSDGKLTTGIKDVRIRKVLEELVKAGAPEEILYKQKPHIGTDLLRIVVKGIRQEIIRLGGQVRFETRLEEILCEPDRPSAGGMPQQRVRGIRVRNLAVQAGLGNPASLVTPADGVAPANPVASADGVAPANPVASADEMASANLVASADEVAPANLVASADEVAPANPVASAEGEGYRDGEEIIDCEVVVLAVGHSARDTFRMLKEKRIAMTQKPFSIGVRIEHSQDLIDIAQYGKPARELGLPVAEYKVNYRCMADGPAEGRGVYTFCMCPGGHVISAASQPGGIVTNGMSYHDRDSSMANSALLCDVRTSDFGSDDVLAGVVFQEKYEQLAFAARRKLAESGAALQVDGTASEGGALPVDGGALLTEGGAAQTLGKPVETQSTDGTNPYAPPKSTWGMLRDGHAPEVESCLPAFAMAAFREAMPYLGKKLKGFDDEKAVVSAVETRSSSPIRMTRDDGYEGRIEMGMESASESSGGADAKTGLELDAATDAKTGAEPDVTADAKTGAEPGVAADTKTGAEPGVAADTKTGRLHGFYPCGEGAGYAGGITSAAVDGIRVAEAIIGSWLM